MITIQNNKRQRRILIFDSAFNLEESNDFPSEMFDAVFIYASSPDEAKSILNTINPVTSRKCCYKPFLVSRELKGRLDEYDELIDNYTYDIDDSETLDTVDEIINHVAAIGLQPDEHGFLSGNLFFIRLYRYLISRRVHSLTPELNDMSGIGYSIPLFELFFQIGAYSLSEYIMFNQLLLEKRYIRPVSFINKIYLCPRCLHSHLLYIESCPHCHSSAIKSEEVIHHFRCANISPEHTYNFGGQLRCPKCHRLLRHIGVDYDRPSVVYSCSHCENTFIQARMAAVCTSCSHHADVSDLTPYDIIAFEITQEGRAAIVSPNIGFTIYTDFYDNYMEFERFLGHLRLLSELKGTDSTDADFEVIKAWVLNGQEETCPLSPDFIALFCKHFPTYRVSSANHIVYLKNTLYADSTKGHSDAALVSKLDALLNKEASRIRPDERICYAISRPTGSMEEFVDSLHYVSPFPDRSFAFRYEEQPKTVEKLPETEVERARPDTPADPRPATTAKEIYRSHKTFIAIALTIVATLAVVCIVLYATGRQPADTLQAETGPAELEEVTVPAEMPPVQASEEEEPTEAAPEAEEAPDEEPDGGFTQRGMYYVVTNVFSTEENALKQQRMEEAEDPGRKYRIYRYGNRFIVSPFHAADREECQLFIAAGGCRGDAWIAKGRGATN